MLRQSRARKKLIKLNFYLFQMQYHKSEDHHLHHHHHHHSAGHDNIDLNTPTDHLSPPSTTSRLSDSDTSECDIDGLTTGRDGASISSLGSSSSPPPEVHFTKLFSKKVIENI